MKNYLSETIDLTTDGYINPVGAPWGDGSGTHQRNVGSITSIAIHHTATVRAHDYDSVSVIKQETAQHYARLGPGLQYHAVIDNVGQIFYTRPFTTWLYAVGSSENVSTLNIVLDGYFHPPYNQKPTREQYEALGQLLINLCEQHPEFPATYPDVRPHRDFSSTACPGDLLAPWVFAIQKKSDVLNIPANAVYDWPQYQPGAIAPATPATPATPIPPSPPVATPTPPPNVPSEPIIPPTPPVKEQAHDYGKENFDLLTSIQIKLEELINKIKEYFNGPPNPT